MSCATAYPILRAFCGPSPARRMYFSPSLAGSSSPMTSSVTPRRAFKSSCEPLRLSCVDASALRRRQKRGQRSRRGSGWPSASDARWRIVKAYRQVIATSCRCCERQIRCRLLRAKTCVVYGMSRQRTDDHEQGEHYRTRWRLENPYSSIMRALETQHLAFIDSVLNTSVSGASLGRVASLRSALPNVRLTVSKLLLQ